MNYQKYVQKFRKKYIPETYNQIELVDELTNPDIDHYISISNRSDGKSFNYLHFFMNLSVDFNVGFMLLSRKFTLRNSYVSLVEKIVKKSDILDESKLGFLNTQNYVKVVYVDRIIGIIADLNSATNLKYDSNFIDDFPIIVYDEFLAIEGDYLPDEWERLKTIYGSVNRGNDIPIIQFPKLFYLGNAVNFSSPILSNLNLFHRLENQGINTMRQYGNILVEMRHNQFKNETRNLRAFDEEKDDMTQGKFSINDYKIVSEFERKQLAKDRRFIIVKLPSQYLRIDYNYQEKLIVLSILGFADDYSYNTEISDNKEKSTYLDDSYYSDLSEKKHIKGFFKYDNAYSKEVITRDIRLTRLKIIKLVKQDMEKYRNVDRTQEKYNQNYIERTKKSLIKRFR